MGLSVEARERIALGVGAAILGVGIASPAYGAYREFIETPKIEKQVRQDAQLKCGDINLDNAIKQAQQLQFKAGPQLLREFKLKGLIEELDRLEGSGIAACYSNYKDIAGKAGVLKDPDKEAHYRGRIDGMLLFGAIGIPGSLFAWGATRFLFFDSWS